MDALISVIIPVYRVEAYLGRCMDSVLAQTYENMEIILVDDGRMTAVRLSVMHMPSRMGV